jgi:hypothetical protein
MNLKGIFRYFINYLINFNHLLKYSFKNSAIYRILKKVRRFRSNIVRKFIIRIHAHVDDKKVRLLENVDVRNIFVLSKVMKNTRTEIYSPNSYYGHADIIKRYAHVSKYYQLKSIIEHGIYFGKDINENEIICHLPSLFTFGSFRKEILQKKTDKTIYAIGPIIAYANYSLGAQKRENEKQRLGRNLLVFPAHSTRLDNANFDIEKHCYVIKGLSRGFDSVRICLYWKDVNRGYDKIYSKFGFECVTAGHIYDPLFLPRLKTIIDCSSITISNQIGSHIGYCIALGKPHYVDQATIDFTVEPGISIPIEEIVVPCEYTEDITEVLQTFSEFRFDISKEQIEVVNKYWGLNEYKSPAEMKQILHETELLYKEKNISNSLKNRVSITKNIYV